MLERAGSRQIYLHQRFGGVSSLCRMKERRKRTETTSQPADNVAGTALLSRRSIVSALSNECGTACSAMVANANEPQIQSCAAEPVPLFQLVTGGNPPRRDDVRQIPAVATER